MSAGTEIPEPTFASLDVVDNPCPHCQSVEVIRLGLEDGCHWACGCEHPGNPSKCIHADRFAALTLVVDALDAAENLRRYFAHDNLRGTHHALQCELAAALQRLREPT